MLTAAIVLAVVGYFLISFSCSYTFVSTIMTARITVPGIWMFPYKEVLAIAAYLILHALYVWARPKGDTNHTKPPRDPLLFVILSGGVAVIGFLLIDYPCPNVIDLWLLLRLPVQLALVSLPYIPYGGVLVLAACLLLYAAYARATQKRGTVL